MSEWKPTLPRGFPLTPTKRGYVVTVGGKTRWVCGKRTPKEALAIYAKKLSAWQTDATPLPVAETPPVNPTLHYVLNKWLLAQRGAAQRGQLKGNTFQEYKRGAKRLDIHAGHHFTDEITPDTVEALYDKLHHAYGEDAARRAISHLRACAREAEDRGWCQPMRIGKKLVAKLTSRDKPKMRWRLYTREEIRRILLACNRRIRTSKGPSYRHPWEQLKAMILLALNGGYGARELSELPRDVIDIDRGRTVIDYKRGKTSKDHMVPLWPETTRALRVVMPQRPDDELLFRTRSGNPWAREANIYKAGKLLRTVSHDNVAWAFNELVKPIGLKIESQSFYKLRHLHATTADAGGDIHATFVLAGHGVPGARGHYVAVGWDRLQKLVDYLRHELLLKPHRDLELNRPAK